MIRHLVAYVVKADGEAEGDGMTHVVASTADSDRMGDIMVQEWDLAEFKANPVILYAHDTGGYGPGTVIGRGIDPRVEDGALRIGIQWDDHESNELAQRVARQFRDGFMSAVSVGFRPGAMTARASLPEGDDQRSDRGWVFGSKEAPNTLLELSAVPVPANSNALAERQGIAAKANDPGDLTGAIVSALRTDEGRAVLAGVLAEIVRHADDSDPLPDSVGFDTPLSLLTS